MDWKDFWKSVAEWNKKGLKDQLCPGYVFNKWVFWTCMILVFLFGLLIINNHGWNFKNQFYFHCPENKGICQNPFHQNNFSTTAHKCPINDESFCNQEFFFPGYTYGNPISSDIKTFPLYVLLIFGLGFLFNHLAFNKKRRIPR